MAGSFPYGSFIIFANARSILRVNHAVEVFFGGQFPLSRVKAKNAKSLDRPPDHAGVLHVDLITAHVSDGLGPGQVRLTLAQGFFRPTLVSHIVRQDQAGWT